MVFVRVNDQIQQIMQDHGFKCQKHENPYVDEIVQKYIEYKILKDIVDKHNRKQSKKIYLHALFDLNQDIIYTKQYQVMLVEADVNPEDMKIKQQINKRQQEREYQKMVLGNNYGKVTGMFGKEIQDMEKTVSYGVSFIFTLFLSGASGYYFGKSILEWQQIPCLILALVVTMGTLIIETILFIIRSGQKDQTNQTKEKSLFGKNQNKIIQQDEQQSEKKNN